MTTSRYLLGSLMSVVLLLSFSSAQAGVIGLWTFDEYAAGGNIASDRIVLDSSGNDRHLKALLNPNTIVGPSGTTALFLNGTGSRLVFDLGYTGNDATNTSQTASSSDIVFSTTGGTSESFTIEVIVQLPQNPDGAGGIGVEGGILGKGGFVADSGTDGWFLNAINNGTSHPNTLEAFIGDGASPLGTTRVSKISEQNIVDDWHHVAAVRNRNLDNWTLYIDGIQVAQFTGAAANGVLENALGDFVIGARDSAAASGYFRGGIDLVKISDEALAPEDFVAIPEPSSVTLALAGLGAIMFRRKH